MAARKDPDGLRDLLPKSTPNFDKIEPHGLFWSLWTMGEPQVISHFLSQLPVFLPTALHLGTPYDKAKAIHFLNIFKCASARARFQLVSDSRFFNPMLDFINHLDERSVSSREAYFTLLGELVFDGSSIAPRFARDDFFAALFGAVHIYPAYKIVSAILSSGPKALMPRLERISFCVILLDNAVSQNVDLRRASQKLFIEALRNRTAFAVPAALLEKDRLVLIINFSCDRQDPDSVHFLTEIAQSPLTASRAWAPVHRLLKEFMPKFCKLALSHTVFVRLTKEIVYFAIFVTQRSKRLENSVRNLTVHLCNLFFDFPLNTNLHNAFMAIVESLSSANLLTPDLLQEMNLFGKIIDAYRNRQRLVQSCYWGQLSRIAEIIDKDARLVGVDAALWRRDVIRTNQERNLIIKRPYGGARPEFGVKKTSDTAYLLGLGGAVIIIFLLVAIFLGML
jgi:hypothetical protein